MGKAPIDVREHSAFFLCDTFVYAGRAGFRFSVRGQTPAALSFLASGAPFAVSDVQGVRKFQTTNLTGICLAVFLGRPQSSDTARA